MTNPPPQQADTILWLPGWSMPASVFESLQQLLPGFLHASADFGCAETPEQIADLAEAAAIACRNRIEATPASRTSARRRLLVAGWSLGGLLAQRIAAQGLADGLVLIASTARFVRTKDQADRGQPEAALRQMTSALAKDREAVERTFRHNLFTEAEREAGLVFMLPPPGSWSLAALLAGLQVLRSENYVSRLPDMSCPVLLIHGTSDTICPYGAAEELLVRLPEAEIVKLEGAGHAPFLGREAAITQAIRSWCHE
jgi:pimeloyl-[acyl-carrier protein] methyl ester esterase